MPDQHGVPVPAQNLVKSHGIGDQRADAVVPVPGNRAGRVPAHERRHGMEPSPGQDGQQMTPGVGGVRKSVQT